MLNLIVLSFVGFVGFSIVCIEVQNWRHKRIYELRTDKKRAKKIL